MAGGSSGRRSRGGGVLEGCPSPMGVEPGLCPSPEHFRNFSFKMCILVHFRRVFFSQELKWWEAAVGFLHQLNPDPDHACRPLSTLAITSSSENGGRGGKIGLA